MTSPEPKPEKQDAAPKPPDKTRRAVILATVGIFIILGLAVLYVAVVAPLRGTHKVVREYIQSTWSAAGYDSEIVPSPPSEKETIQRLGGPDRALGRLVTYLRLPRWMKTEREYAALLLGNCGPRAVPELVKLLEHADADVRLKAAWSLGLIGPNAKAAVPALVKALGDSVIEVRCQAVWTLADIGPEAKTAVPALQKLFRDENEDVTIRFSAADALGKIRGLEPAPDAPAAPPAPEEE